MEQQHIKTAVSNVQNLAVNKYKQATTAIDRYVSNSPWNAIGIAAAFGAVVGFITRRR
jgi:ElaB/YqjD/DUF883 family membrane-anchored ribosome-binding protein